MARILVIDDDAAVRDVLAQLLQLEGHEVALAPDGRVGLRSFREAPYDLVLLDMLMPEQEGLETLRAIRKENPGARVIAISGGGRFGARECLTLARALGATLTLEKPLRAQELSAAVKRALES